MVLKKNIGTTDKALRIAVGAALLSLVPVAALVPGWEWGYLGAVGILPLVTAITGYCLPYAILGLDSCGQDGCG